MFSPRHQPSTMVQDCARRKNNGSKRHRVRWQITNARRIDWPWRLPQYPEWRLCGKGANAHTVIIMAVVCLFVAVKPVVVFVTDPDRRTSATEVTRGPEKWVWCRINQFGVFAVDAQDVVIRLCFIDSEKLLVVLEELPVLFNWPTLGIDRFPCAQNAKII